MRLFDAEKTSSQVAWKRPYFRSVLKDFSGLKKSACKSPLRPLYWVTNMINKRPLSRLILAFTTYTRIFFKKTNKTNQMHVAKKVLKSVFWVKVIRKLPIENLRLKPLYNSCKEDYFSFLNK